MKEQKRKEKQRKMKRRRLRLNGFGMFRSFEVFALLAVLT